MRILVISATHLLGAMSSVSRDNEIAGTGGLAFVACLSGDITDAVWVLEPPAAVMGEKSCCRKM